MADEMNSKTENDFFDNFDEYADELEKQLEEDSKDNGSEETIQTQTEEADEEEMERDRSDNSEMTEEEPEEDEDLLEDQEPETFEEEEDGKDKKKKRAQKVGKNGKEKLEEQADKRRRAKEALGISDEGEFEIERVPGEYGSAGILNIDDEQSEIDKEIEEKYGAGGIGTDKEEPEPASAARPRKEQEEGQRRPHASYKGNKTNKQESPTQTEETTETSSGPERTVERERTTENVHELQDEWIPKDYSVMEETTNPEQTVAGIEEITRKDRPWTVTTPSNGQDTIHNVSREETKEAEKDEIKPHSLGQEHQSEGSVYEEHHEGRPIPHKKNAVPWHNETGAAVNEISAAEVENTVGNSLGIEDRRAEQDENPFRTSADAYTEAPVIGQEEKTTSVTSGRGLLSSEHAHQAKKEHNEEKEKENAQKTTTSSKRSAEKAAKTAQKANDTAKETAETTRKTSAGAAFVSSNITTPNEGDIEQKKNQQGKGISRLGINLVIGQTGNTEAPTDAKQKGQTDGTYSKGQKITGLDDKNTKSKTDTKEKETKDQKSNDLSSSHMRVGDPSATSRENLRTSSDINDDQKHMRMKQSADEAVKTSRGVTGKGIVDAQSIMRGVKGNADTGKFSEKTITKRGEKLRISAHDAENSPITENNTKSTQGILPTANATGLEQKNSRGPIVSGARKEEEAQKKLRIRKESATEEYYKLSAAQKGTIKFTRTGSTSKSHADDIVENVQTLGRGAKLNASAGKRMKNISAAGVGRGAKMSLGHGMKVGTGSSLVTIAGMAKNSSRNSMRFRNMWGLNNNEEAPQQEEKDKPANTFLKAVGKKALSVLLAGTMAVGGYAGVSYFENTVKSNTADLWYPVQAHISSEKDNDEAASMTAKALSNMGLRLDAYQAMVQGEKASSSEKATKDLKAINIQDVRIEDEGNSTEINSNAVSMKNLKNFTYQYTYTGTLIFPPVKKTKTVDKSQVVTVDQTRYVTVPTSKFTTPTTTKKTRRPLHHPTSTTVFSDQTPVTSIEHYTETSVSKYTETTEYLEYPPSEISKHTETIYTNGVSVVFEFDDKEGNPINGSITLNNDTISGNAQGIYDSAEAHTGGSLVQSKKEEDMQWGTGSTDTYVDETHFIWNVLSDAGLFTQECPKTIADWKTKGREVADHSNIQVGDVVIYKTEKGKEHIAFYAKDTSKVYCLEGKEGIQVKDFSEKNTIETIRRFADDGAQRPISTLSGQGARTTFLKSILSMSVVGTYYDDPSDMDKYNQYCYDILDAAVANGCGIAGWQGSEVVYTVVDSGEQIKWNEKGGTATANGKELTCQVIVHVCADLQALEASDKKFTSWDIEGSENGDRHVASYMELAPAVFDSIFNVSTASGISSGLALATGEQPAYAFFKGKGLDDVTIAAILANISAESSFNPSATNDKGAYGLFQWLGTRKDKLFEYAKTTNPSMTTQLEYAWMEMSGEGISGANAKMQWSKTDWKTFKKEKDPYAAAVYFAVNWERYRDPETANPNEDANRGKKAKEYYNKICTGTLGGTDYLQWAVNIANDDTHGYSQVNRRGPDYDCASLVWYSLFNTGYPIDKVCAYPFSVGGMDSALTALGFTRITIPGRTDFSVLQPGDILVNPHEHTEIYVGNGQALGAHYDENKDIVGAMSGDQTGMEISIIPIWCQWTFAYRPPQQ